jgi:hypothetical protein
MMYSSKKSCIILCSSHFTRVRYTRPFAGMYARAQSHLGLTTLQSLRSSDLLQTMLIFSSYFFILFAYNLETYFLYSVLKLIEKIAYRVYILVTFQE